MAKGLKLTTSHSERLLGIYRQCPIAGYSPELSEDEVWSVINRQDELHVNRPSNIYTYTCTSIGSGLNSLALHEDQYHDHNTQTRSIVHKLRSPHGQRNVASSVPVNIPNWSIDSVEVLGEMNLYDDDDDDEGELMVPPHEYLAREYKGIVTNSVFEGVGRTLKGRDMRRVRDSVWGQTGFNG